MVARNDPAGPLIALIGAAACCWGAYAVGRAGAGAAAGGPVVLSGVQIGLIALAMLLLVYGIIGLVSVWLEGTAAWPRVEPARGGRIALAVGLLGVILLVAGAGLFAGFILRDLRATNTSPVRDGLLAGAIFLVAAFLVVFYRRFFVDAVVKSDDEHSEVPW